MPNPKLDDEEGRYNFWKKSFKRYSSKEDMIHSAATALALRDAEIHRFQTLLKELSERSSRSENYPTPEKVRYSKPFGVYDPEFGDARQCVCGHPYSRHFDPYESQNEEEFGPAGCKYCPCGRGVSEEGSPCGFREDLVDVIPRARKDPESW